MSDDSDSSLKVGDKAPFFRATASGGKTISLADFTGKPVVLFFYPRNFTPVCTKEACAFRDSYKEFEQKGAVVLGISINTAASHDKFVEKYKLPFPLLADP